MPLVISFDALPALIVTFPPIEVRHISGDPYLGPYTVAPDFIGTILPTTGKIMLDDVTVEAIEVQRVSNPQGGKTIYIGGNTNG